MTNNQIYQELLQLTSSHIESKMSKLQILCKRIRDEEREACAKLCEESDRYRGSYFADKIRNQKD